jgi:hypothetical protein
MNNHRNILSETLDDGLTAIEDLAVNVYLDDLEQGNAKRNNQSRDNDNNNNNVLSSTTALSPQSTSSSSTLPADSTNTESQTRKKKIDTILKKVRIEPYLKDLCIKRYGDVFPTQSHCHFKKRRRRSEYIDFIFNHGTTTNTRDPNNNSQCPENEFVLFMNNLKEEIDEIVVKMKRQDEALKLLRKSDRESRCTFALATARESLPKILDDFVLSNNENNALHKYPLIGANMEDTFKSIIKEKSEIALTSMNVAFFDYHTKDDLESDLNEIYVNFRNIEYGGVNKKNILLSYKMLAQVFFIDFLSPLYETNLARGEIKPDSVPALDNHGKTALYYLGGYIFRTICSESQLNDPIKSKIRSSFKTSLGELDINERGELPTKLVEHNFGEKSATYLSLNAFNFFLRLEAIVHGLSTLNNVRRARTHLINECIKWAKSDTKLKELALVIIQPRRSTRQRRSTYQRKRKRQKKNAELSTVDKQVNDMIELITRKYMRTRVKAAMRYLMDEIGIGSGTEIRQVLKVTAELKLETTKTDEILKTFNANLNDENAITK